MATNTLPAKRTGKAGSTIALKTLMAASGLFFVLFVLAHMYGNLKLLVGEKAFNEYAHHLRTIGEPMLPYRGLLDIMEVLLVLALIAHVYAATQLWKRAGSARSQRYAVKKSLVGGVSPAAMRWGGAFLLLFVIFHLIQFTLPKVNFDGGNTDNPYRLVHDSFGLWWVALIYICAMIALGMHLLHGIWSASQTLGLTDRPSSRKKAKTVAAVVAAVVVIGFLIPPLCILFGII